MDYNDIATKAIIQAGALQKPYELALLLEAAARAKPKILVEIGTAQGGVFWALCRVAPDNATIISIDLPNGPYGGGYSEDDVKKFQSYGQRRQKLYFLRENSHYQNTLKKLLGIIGDKKIDLLFIDGDHTYGGVKQDWNMYAPLVKRGGIVALHDICNHPFQPEVKVEELWAEIKKQHKSEEFVDPCEGRWGGIGLLRYGVKPEQKAPIVLDGPEGILLHLSRNVRPPKEFIVMSPNGNGDIHHDFESFPWPFKDNSVHICLAPHVVEHIKPWLIVDFMNEVWRIMRPNGQFAISTPYAGSPAYWTDPTHCCGFNEKSFGYFCEQYGAAAKNHTKPWTVERGYPIWRVDSNLEIVLHPVK